MKRRVSALAAALLLLTSGCLGGIQPPEPSHEDDDIVRTVTTANATHIQQLYGNHVRTLMNTTGYRSQLRIVDNDTVEADLVWSVDRVRNRVLQRNEHPSNDTVHHVYLDSSGKHAQLVQNGTVTAEQARTHDRAGFREEFSYSGRHLAPDELVLARYDFEYVGHKDGAYIFEAEDLRPRADVQYPNWYWGMEDAVDANARLVVDDRGFVRSLSTSVTLQRHGETTTEQYQLRVSAVNDVQVKEPNWVDEAA